MSLKVIHIVFVSVASLLAFGFGAWCLQNGQPAGVALGGFVSGVGLIVYGVKFYHKIKALKIE